MPARSLGLLMFVLFVLSPLAGCGPALGTVAGTVTVDGKPLDNGSIVFSPADANGEAVTTEIHDGQYQATMVAGKKFVQISAPVVVERRKDSDHPKAPIIERTEESLPPRYHSESQLTFEVKSGPNTKDWRLDRKPWLE